jgi:pimeloyl-ACP methyl ester carboxylesterase
MVEDLWKKRQQEINAMQHTIKYKNNKIRYSVSGKGKTVVFVHGFTESMEMWSAYEQKLSLSHKIICIDLPGHGQSENIDEVHTMPMMANVINVVLDRENIRKCTIIGHSLGGYVSLAFAKLFPESLDALVLFHSSASKDTKEIKQNRDRLIEIVKANKLGFINDFIPSLFAPCNRKKYASTIKSIIKQSNRTPVSGIVAALKGMKQREDSRKLLENLNIPVLFIAGKQDSRIPMEKILPQIALPRQSHALLLESVGHMGFVEAPDTCLHAIQSIIN